MIITVNFELFFYYLDSYPVRYFHPLDNEHISYLLHYLSRINTSLLLSSPPHPLSSSLLCSLSPALLIVYITSFYLICSPHSISSYFASPPQLSLSSSSSSIYISSIFFFSSSIPFHTLRLIFNA